MNIFWLGVQALVNIAMLPRDIGLGLTYFKISRQMNKWASKGWTIHQVFDEFAIANPNKVAVYSQNESWNFKQLRDYSLKIATYFNREGYKKGDPVALFMENHPRFIGTWLGLTRIGVVVALLNSEAKGKVLIHAVSAATTHPCKAIIVGKGLTPPPGKMSKNLITVLEESKSFEDQDLKWPDNFKIYISGYESRPTTYLTIKNLDNELRGDKLIQPVDPSITKGLNMDSSMVYVYTSGTTGMPKAAVFKFRRFATLVASSHLVYKIRSDDVIYSPMPLFHASGGLVGSGQMLLFGLSMVIREKFSASAYFPDCKKYGVTVAQYIGEICSYVYSQPPAPTDKEHKVRLMMGNGMRRVLWEKFQKRFNIKEIGEFYGSTEGNANLGNNRNKVGSVGYMPCYASFIYPIHLIQYDENDFTPLRGKNGLCKEAKTDRKGRTKGLLVGEIKKSSTGLSNFEGYANGKSTDSKIIRDVFKKGDTFFNSGDVLEKDIFCYYYFVDRLGDTFRWKGENVATSQLENIISKELPIEEGKLVVYGVQVQGQEGKAGMVAFLADAATFNFQKLLELSKKHLDGPRTPVFLRFTDNYPRTPTQKIQKVELAKQGFNPKELKNVGGGVANDKLYYLDQQTKKYEELTQEKYELILQKVVRI